MITPGADLKVYVATKPVDFRRGMNGLALAVQEMLGLDPYCGAAFVFRAKRSDRSRFWYGSASSESWHVQQGKSCQGNSQSPVVWIAEEMETEPLKPIDKVS